MPHSGSALPPRRLRPYRHRPLRPATQPLTSQALPPQACLGSELTLTAPRPRTKGNKSCPGPPGSGPKSLSQAPPLLCHTPRPAQKPRPPLSPDTQDSAFSRAPDDPAAPPCSHRTGPSSCLAALRPPLLQARQAPPPSRATPPRPQTPPSRAVASPPPGRGSGGCAGCAVCSASLRAVAPRRAAQSSR